MIPIEHTNTAYTYKSENQAQVTVSVAAVCALLTGQKKAMCTSSK